MEGVNASEPATDAELLAAVPFDLAAYEAFYRRYLERVTAFAVSRCSNADDVADVVAQTFLRLLRAAESYDPAKGTPAAFVRGLMLNVVRDLHRRRSRYRALVTKLSGRHLLDNDDIERLEAAIDAARAADGVHRALALLPRGEQRVLHLVAEGHTARQAAAVVGISPAAARKRLSRARQRVRTHLDDQRGADR